MKRRVSFLLGVFIPMLGAMLMLPSCTSCTRDPLWTEGHEINNELNEFRGKLSVYMDASVSMKGYVTVDSSDFNRDVPIVLSDLRSNLAMKSGEEYYMVVDWNDKTKPTAVTYDAFKKQMIDPNGKSYTGQTTQIYSIINQIATALKSGDVGVFITDGVLSEGYAKIHESKKDNTYFFGDLRREVKEALDLVYDKGLSVAIIRSNAHYDGKFYYACNEEKVKGFAGEIMRKRPYYYFLFGEEDVLQSVLKAFSIKDASQYVTSYFTMTPKKVNYSLAMTAQNSGINGIEYPVVGDTVEDKSQLDIHIELKGFYDEEPSEICLCLPKLTSGGMVRLVDTLLSDNNRYFKVKSISKAECRNKVGEYREPSDNYWDQVGMCYLLTFKKSDEILNAIDDRKECVLSLVYENPLIDEKYTVDNDLNKTLKEMEGRTFGFAQFMEAIEFSKFNRNMESHQSKVATIKFNIIID